MGRLAEQTLDRLNLDGVHMNKNRFMIYIFLAGIILVFYFLNILTNHPQPEIKKANTVYTEDQIKKLEEAVRLAPINPEVLKSMTDYYIPDPAFKDHNKALEHYFKAAALDPKNGEILQKIAWVYFKKANFPEVINYANKILEVAPAMTHVAYVLLADSYYELRDYEKTVAYFDQLSQLDSYKSDKPVYSQRLGKAYYYLGRYQDTIRIFQPLPRLSEIQGGRFYSLRTDISGVAYLYLGLSYYKMGQPVEAKDSLADALELFLASGTGWRKKEIEIIQFYLQKL